MRLAEFQQRFIEAVLNPESKVTDQELGIKPRKGASAQNAIHIHQSHFWYRIRKMLTFHHTQLSDYLGPKEFLKAAQSYIKAYPPYGQFSQEIARNFAQFLASSEPWSRYPLLHELAKADWQKRSAIASAFEKPLEPSELQTHQGKVILKKRARVVEVRYRFHEIDFKTLPKDTKPDSQPTYILYVHYLRRATQKAIDRQMYEALLYLQEPRTLGELKNKLASWSLTEPQAKAFIDSLAEEKLLVRIAA